MLEGWPFSISNSLIISLQSSHHAPSHAQGVVAILQQKPGPRRAHSPDLPGDVASARDGLHDGGKLIGVEEQRDLQPAVAKYVHKLIRAILGDRPIVAGAG